MTKKYNKEDLEANLKVLNSILSKCRKAKTPVKEKSSQEPLLGNRINALETAVELIEAELVRRIQIK